MSSVWLSVVGGIVLAMASQGACAEPPTSSGSAPDLATSAETYWSAVAKRDWETTYQVDMIDEGSDGEEGSDSTDSKQQDTEAASASDAGKAGEAAPEAVEKTPEQLKQAYILRKQRALGRLYSYKIGEVRLDESGISGTAAMSLRVPLRRSQGYAHRQLDFVDHWSLVDGQWRRLGTRGAPLSTSVVPAPGVRSEAGDVLNEPEAQFEAPRYELPGSQPAQGATDSAPGGGEASPDAGDLSD